MQSAWEVYGDKVGEIGTGAGGLTAEVVGVNIGGCLPQEPTSSHSQLMALDWVIQGWRGKKGPVYVMLCEFI